jgi:hypothetical protein
MLGQNGENCRTVATTRCAGTAMTAVCGTKLEQTKA